MNADTYLKEIDANDDFWDYERSEELSYTDGQIVEFAERYHQAKLKLLGIGGVSQQHELLEAYTNKLNQNRLLNCRVYKGEIDEFLASNCG